MHKNHIGALLFLAMGLLGAIYFAIDAHHATRDLARLSPVKAIVLAHEPISCRGGRGVKPSCDVPLSVEAVGQGWTGRVIAARAGDRRGAERLQSGFALRSPIIIHRVEGEDGPRYLGEQEVKNLHTSAAPLTRDESWIVYLCFAMVPLIALSPVNRRRWWQ